MNYKSIIILVFSFFIGSKLQAQKTIHVTKTQKKCLVASNEIDFEKEFEWKEVDCSELEKSSKAKRTPEQIIKRKQYRIKLVKYQEKLKSLGYDIDTNGLIDEKTIKAHNKYLKRKRKAEKKALRKSKNQSL